MLNDFSKLDAQTIEGTLAQMSPQEASAWFDFSELPSEVRSVPIPPQSHYSAFVQSKWSLVAAIVLFVISFAILAKLMI